MKDGSDGAIIDGWDESAEGGAETEGDGVAESEAKITDGETEGESADAPEDSPEKGVVNAGGRGFAKNADEVGNEDEGEDEWGDDPCGEALDDPIDLPRPAPDATEGDEVGGGGETAYPVVDNAEKRIWSHVASLRSVIMILQCELSYLSGVALRNGIEFAGGCSASFTVYCLL